MLKNNYDICISSSDQSHSHVTSMIKMSLLYSLKVMVNERKLSMGHTRALFDVDNAEK